MCTRVLTPKAKLQSTCVITHPGTPPYTCDLCLPVLALKINVNACHKPPLGPHMRSKIARHSVVCLP